MNSYVISISARFNNDDPTGRQFQEIVRTFETQKAFMQHIVEQQADRYVQHLRRIIEENTLATALFEADMLTDLGTVDGFDDLYTNLPKWLTDAIDNGELVICYNWDWDFWGSDSAVQCSITERSAIPNEYTERLEAWKDDHANEYEAFCTGLDSAIWNHVQKQENFELFDGIMRG